MDTGCVEIHLANPAHREIIIDDSQVLHQPSIIFVIFHRFWFNLFPFADILSFAPSSITLDYILEKLDLILIIYSRWIFSSWILKIRK